MDNFSDKELEGVFTRHGGYFHTPMKLLKEQSKNLKAYVFDWKGVFNNGFSPFHSASFDQDAMGILLIQFSHWLKFGEIPVVAIICEDNLPVVYNFVKEHHFSAYYYNIKDKELALKHLCQQLDISFYHVSLTFDDISDLPSAKQCGIRFLVNRKGSPLMYKILHDHHWVDYVTAQSAGGYAVREISELIATCHGNGESTLDHIARNSPEFAAFLKKREQVSPTKYKFSKDRLVLEDD